MLSAFFEKLGGGLAERFLERLFSPAFLFWGGGALILAGRYGFDRTWRWLTELSVPQQAGLLVLALLGLTLSAALMRHLTLPWLRLLEGYWPGPLQRLALWLGARKARRLARWQREWNALMDRQEAGPLTPLQRRRLAELEVRLHYHPADPADCLPTDLGNALRFAETAPLHRYGLDAAVVWPTLWLLLPQEVREELGAARARLDGQVRAWAWGVLFLLWSPLWPGALAIGLLWAWLAYRLAVASARTFADLVLAAFTLHRFALYDALGWERPRPGEEKDRGARLTAFLWRGL